MTTSHLTPLCLKRNFDACLWGVLLGSWEALCSLGFLYIHSIQLLDLPRGKHYAGLRDTTVSNSALPIKSSDSERENKTN